MNPGAGRKALLGSIATLIVVAAVEGFSWILLSIDEGRPYAFASDRKTRAILLDPAASPSRASEEIPLATPNAEIIHPFLGFVVDPDRRPGFTAHGLPAPERPAAEGDFRVAVFGGSFAEGLVRQAGAVLARALEEEGVSAGRPAAVEVFALGGYKQPQQLLALAWLLSLGESFDLVVNLDGFNEVALPGAENADIVFPFYPRGWPARVSNFIDPAKLEMVAELSALSRRQVSLARRFDGFPLRISPTANLVWRSLQRRTVARRASVAAEMEAYSASRSGDPGFIARGPGYAYGSHGEMIAALADHWMRSSLQISHLASAGGIPYFHFLQPNQYDAGSKPLTSREMSEAFREDHPYREGVVTGYPLLRERGARLAGMGVRFHDLSRIFAGERESLYVDDCCHVSREGYGIVAREIARIIATDPGTGAPGGTGPEERGMKSGG